MLSSMQKLKWTKMSCEEHKIAHFEGEKFSLNEPSAKYTREDFPTEHKINIHKSAESSKLQFLITGNFSWTPKHRQRKICRLNKFKIYGKKIFAFFTVWTQWFLLEHLRSDFYKFNILIVWIFSFQEQHNMHPAYAELCFRFSNSELKRNC